MYTHNIQCVLQLMAPNQLNQTWFYFHTQWKAYTLLKCYTVYLQHNTYTRIYHNVLHCTSVRFNNLIGNIKYVVFSFCCEVIRLGKQ